MEGSTEAMVVEKKNEMRVRSGGHEGFSLGEYEVRCDGEESTQGRRARGKYSR